MKFNPDEPSPTAFPESNFTYTSPKGMEDTCGDLPCFRFSGNEKAPPMAISRWVFPTRAQRLKFLKDGVMWLTVLMAGHPPVALAVESPFTQPVDPSAPTAAMPPRPKLVILESPYRGKRFWHRWANIRYSRACVRDSLMRNESPLASHLLLTQPGILRDSVEHERHLGISAGLAWGVVAEATVVYTDRGISKGMQLGIDNAADEGRPVEFRTLKSK